MNAYRPPKIYEFPPFFTKQVNEQTWAAQKRHWHSVILGYCRANSLWRLPLDSELFTNPRIQRSLKEEVTLELLESFVTAQNGEWLPAKSGVLVYIQSAPQVAEEIRRWGEDTGHSDTVLTLYELGSGDLAGLEDIAGVDQTILLKAANLLVKNGQAIALKEDGTLVGIKLA